jgi:hypothetical protein
LGSGKTEKQQRALIEAAPKEPGDIVNEKSEAAIQIHDAPG